MFENWLKWFSNAFVESFQEIKTVADWQRNNKKLKRRN